MKLISYFTLLILSFIFNNVKQNVKEISTYLKFYEICFTLFVDKRKLLFYNFSMKNEIRQPRQERSIEKKNKIIQAGYELFSEVGYYGTNTAEIAKRAGVSTGIVYGYFQDKRDILICVLDIYINKIFAPFLKLFEKITLPLDFKDLLTKIVEKTIKTHKNNRKIHEVLHSMASNDEAVNAEFIALEDKITVEIADRLNAIGLKIDNALEKIHFAMDVIQSFSHEYVFDKHEYLDYIVMRDMVINTLVKLFE